MQKPSFLIRSGFSPLHYYQAVVSAIRQKFRVGRLEQLEIPAAIEDEIAQAFRHVKRTLETAGAVWRDVVHVNSCHDSGFPPAVNETTAYGGFELSLSCKR